MELWDLYDINGNRLDKQIKRGDSMPENTYHKIIHVWIQNEKGEFLIQKRADHLKWHPGAWATTTGSVTAGEYHIMESAYRELSEELGLDNTKIDLEFVSEIIIGSSLVSIIKGFLPLFMIQNVKFNDEVTEIKWMTKSKIQMLRAEGKFASYSDETFDIVFKILYN